MDKTKTSQEEIIRERILTILEQQTLTLTELEYIETTLLDVVRLIELNKLTGYKPTTKMNIFPKINPSKFIYTLGKNDMVCKNCFYFTSLEALDGFNSVAKVCDDCLDGSAYQPYKR